MSEVLNFEQLGNQYSQLRAKIENSDDVQLLRSYAAKYGPLYEAGLQNKENAAFDASVRQQLSELTAPAKHAANQLVGLATASTGASADEIIANVGNPSYANSLSLKADLSCGDSAMTAYLKSSQPQMTAANERESDMNVLANLSYMSKACDKPEYQQAIKQEGVTLHDYCDKLLSIAGDDIEPLDKNYLAQLRDSSRFGGLTVDHVYGNTGSDAGEHTIVMAIGTGDGHAVFSIQGTNSNIIDWKTDGRFQGSKITAEEERINSVTNDWAREYSGISLTGHSQGGREAVTAGMYMDPENQAKISRIVSNDGPGYSHAFLNRHSDRVNTIADKVTVIRPAVASGVGEQLTQIGEEKFTIVLQNAVVKYYDKDGNPVYENHHLGTTWPIAENGDYPYTDSNYGLLKLAGLSEMLVDFNSVVLGEEKSLEFGDQLVALLGNEKGEFGFNNLWTEEVNGEKQFSLVKLIDSSIKGIALLGDYKKDLQAGFSQLREDQLMLSPETLEALDICVEISNAIDTICLCLSVAESVCIVLAKVFALCPPAAGFFLAAAGLMVKIDVTLRKINKILKIIVYICDLKAYERAKEKYDARMKYLSSNSSMTVNTDYLSDAIDHLAAASRFAVYAYDAYKKAMSGYIRVIWKTYYLETGEKKEKKIELPVSFLGGRKHAGCGGSKVAQTWEKARNTTPAQNTLNDVIDGVRQVCEKLSHGMDRIFTVNPEQLSSAGQDGVVQSEQLLQQLQACFETLDGLRPSWSTEDYSSIIQKTMPDRENMGNYGQSMKQAFENLSAAASLYSSFQEQSIEAFQNVKM